MQYGPSPQTQEYCHRSSCRIPPAQWGNQDARGVEAKECELFQEPRAAEDDQVQFGLEQEMAHQNELDIAAAPSPSNGSASNLSVSRCKVHQWSTCAS